MRSQALVLRVTRATEEETAQDNLVYLFAEYVGRVPRRLILSDGQLLWTCFLIKYWCFQAIKKSWPFCVYHSPNRGRTALQLWLHIVQKESLHHAPHTFRKGPPYSIGVVWKAYERLPPSVWCLTAGKHAR